MTNLKQLLRTSSKVLSGFFLIAWPCVAWGASSSGVSLTITKSLLGASGSAGDTLMSGGPYSLASALGEPIAGNITNSANESIVSGYFGGVSGNGPGLQLLKAVIGSSAIYQDGVQVGVPPNAPITLVFSDQLDSTTLPAGISVIAAIDHRAQDVQLPAPISFSYDVAGSTVIVTPSTAWSGNTVYLVTLTPDLLSVGDFNLNSTPPIPFVTQLDPREDNVVLHPLPPIAGLSAAPSGVTTTMNIQVPPDALSDFATILVSPDPIRQPLRADPRIIQAANDKAAASGGPYRTPIAIQELEAVNAKGQALSSLSTSANLSFSYASQGGLVGPSGSVVRAGTLALWALDTQHQLWVKLPDSRPTGQSAVAAPVSQFSVFALMGSADGNAADAFVFPTPWRPHGPNAGTGSGQTGTEADGITFSNLPSECTIRIYTISGDLVREIHHSDTNGLLGQEKWDGKNSGGDSAASGVYLWRVESSSNGKNGKLMIIR